MTKRRSVRKSSKKRRATKRSTFRSRMMKRMKFWGGDNVEQFIKLLNNNKLNQTRTIKILKQILNSSVYKDIDQSFKWNITFNIEHHNLKIVDEILTKTELIEKIKNMQNNNPTLVDEMNCKINVERVE